MSLYRNAIWFLNGIHHYTRKGYEAAAKDFDKDLDVSVVGRSFMITGANSGIGRATAMAIAKKGGTVHMVCRNKDKAEEARADIVNVSGNTEVYVHIVDMSETRKVWEFAEAFKKQYPSLNVLINNAGCMVHKREVNAERLEKNFLFSMSLGVYVLTQTLIPLLQKSRDPRVITVSSGGMLVQKLRVNDLQSETGCFDGVMVYAQNKRQQVVLTQQWAKAYPVIHFSVMHPGWVDTPAVSTSMPQFHQMMGDRLRSVEQGADTIVWLALSRAAARTRSGQFFQDRKHVPAHLPLAWTHSSSEEIQKHQYSLFLFSFFKNNPHLPFNNFIIFIQF
uniref:Dehydrogenase/reductase SDR family member 12-like n=1 Tax=Mastacembelus armatus TaxID=205130 RepID=A0A7N9APD5_9TELE